MILFLHNRYRVAGGEEQAVEQLLKLVREQLGEEAELLSVDSSALSRQRAAIALLRGGLDSDDVAAAVRRTGARVVAGHNLLPSYGWRALAAARAAGAAVALHLHNYRLVCAVGTCFSSAGQDCTRCHGRNTAPGVRLGCRGDRAEAAVYAAALSAWQRRLAAQVDLFVVPSVFAAERLAALGAPISAPRVVPHAIDGVVERSSAAAGSYALIASRLAAEKGVDAALEACAKAGLAAVVAGDGPLRHDLREAYPAVRFAGHVDADELAELRAGAALAIVASHAAETFGLAAAEAMAAGLPVAATRIGALPDLVEDAGLAPPGDVAALSAVARARYGDAEAGERGLALVRERYSPGVVADALTAVYDEAVRRRRGDSAVV